MLLYIEAYICFKAFFSSTSSYFYSSSTFLLHISPISSLNPTSSIFFNRHIDNVSKQLRAEFARGDGRVKRKEESRRGHIEPNETLFVVNYNVDRTRREDLEMLFKDYGRLVRVDMRRNYAFVQFESTEDAIKAKDATDGGKLDDSVLSVEFVVSKRRDDRRRSSPSRRGRYDDYDHRSRRSGRRSRSRSYGRGRYRSRSRSPRRRRSRSRSRSRDYGGYGRDRRSRSRSRDYGRDRDYRDKRSAGGGSSSDRGYRTDDRGYGSRPI